MKKYHKLVLLLLKIGVMFGILLSAAGMQAAGKADAMEEDTDTEKMYELFYDEPYETGYYLIKPKIQLKCLNTGMRVCYGFSSSGDSEEEGFLENEGEIFCIEPEMLKEGENILSVWLEEPEEQMQEADAPDPSIKWVMVNGSKQAYSFRVDTKKPEKPEVTFPPQAGSVPYCYQAESVLLISASDQGSGVKEICYRLGEEEEKRVTGSQAEIAIPENFQGNLSVYCTDLAGNTGEVLTTPEFLCDATIPKVIVTAPKGFLGWYREEVTLSLRIRDEEVSSGLEEVYCRVNGQPVLKEYWSGQETRTEYIAEIPVKESSRNGNKIPVTIEVRDHAGNQAVWSDSLQIDRQKPEVFIDPVQEGEITSRPVMMQIIAEDENLLAQTSASITRVNMDGQEERVSGLEWENTDQGRKLVCNLEKDGKYHLLVKAEDDAGNQNVRELNFIIDQTDPIIQYVDQIDGSYIQYFEWNYRAEEMIREMTEYTYSMQLNGMPYFPGSRVLKEGETVLKVRVEDAAGNVSTAVARFIIDHTKPVILFGELVHGKKYEKEALLFISTENEEDSITSILINGEPQKLSKGSKGFRFLIQTSGAYDVEAYAQDAAGNTAVSQISFQVIEQKKSVLDFLDFTQSLLKDRQNVPSKVEKSMAEAILAKKWNAILWILGSAVCGVIVWIVFWVKKRKEKKGPKGRMPSNRNHDSRHVL